MNSQKKKRLDIEDVSLSAPLSLSCSPSLNSSQRLTRVPCRRRNPAVRFGAVRPSLGWRDVNTLALSLGMSFAAFVDMVLDRKDTVAENMSIDELAKVCTLAIRESLANVYRDKFDCFLNNFERSFGSTLRTLRLINESSMNKERCHLGNLNSESCSDSTCNEVECSGSNSYVKDKNGVMTSPPAEIQSRMTTPEELQGNIPMNSMNRELVLQGHMNQLARVPSNSLHFVINQMSTTEKSLMEQARANDLKTLELGLSMEKLKLKEKQLALNFESNHLERSKLAMGVSKASFKAEKFKNQLEDMRSSELLRKCIDCLVAGLFIMIFSLSYGAYIYSYRRITEATASCIPSSEESKSWWLPKPMASFNSGISILKCQAQVVSRMLFGIFMIIAIGYLLLQRSAASKQAMPVTFILLLLGTFCGFAGKFCVDALGGSGYHWLLHWEALCLLHFFSNVYISALFLLLYGPVTVDQRAKRNPMIPYSVRQVLFYAIVPLILPILCGLMPFAGLGEWKDHFSELMLDFFLK